jgi:hypothetical protein
VKFKLEIMFSQKCLTNKMLVHGMKHRLTQDQRDMQNSKVFGRYVCSIGVQFTPLVISLMLSKFRGEKVKLSLCISYEVLYSATYS